MADYEQFGSTVNFYQDSGKTWYYKQRAHIYADIISQTDTQVKVQVTWYLQLMNGYWFYMKLKYSGSSVTTTTLDGVAGKSSEYPGGNTWFDTETHTHTETLTFNRGSSDVTKSWTCATWSYHSGATTTTSSATISITIPKLDKITVSYDANGGDSAPSDQEVSPNTDFNLAGSASWANEEGPTYSCTITGGDGGSYSGSATRECNYEYTHTFLGWSKSSTATSATWTATGKVSGGFSSDTTLYAVWKDGSTHDYFNWPAASAFSHDSDSESFTIYGDGNGGDDTSIDATKTTPYTISSNLVSDYGSSYTFGGRDYLIESEDGCTVYPIWSKGTATYSNNTIGSLGTTTRSDDTEDGYLITFDGNPVSISESPIQAEVDNTYSFKGWFANSSGGSAYPSTKAFYEATTVYAQWTKNQTAQSVSLPTEEIRAGYEFIGWNKTRTGKEPLPFIFNPGIPSLPGTEMPLYAIWKAKGLGNLYINNNYSKALVYVFDGTKYCQAIPYVFDGTSYKIGG